MNLYIYIYIIPLNLVMILTLVMCFLNGIILVFARLNRNAMMSHHVPAHAAGTCMILIFGL